MTSTPWFAFTDPNHIINDRLIMTVTGICLSIGILVVTELSQWMKKSATKRLRHARHKDIGKIAEDRINATIVPETVIPYIDEDNVSSEQDEVNRSRSMAFETSCANDI